MPDPTGPTYRSSKGVVPIAEMHGKHLLNALRKVKGRVDADDYDDTDLAELEALEAEAAARQKKYEAGE